MRHRWGAQKLKPLSVKCTADKQPSKRPLCCLGNHHPPPFSFFRFSFFSRSFVCSSLLSFPISGRTSSRSVLATALVGRIFSWKPHDNRYFGSCGCTGSGMRIHAVLWEGKRESEKVALKPVLHCKRLRYKWSKLHCVTLIIHLQVNHCS